MCKKIILKLDFYNNILILHIHYGDFTGCFFVHVLLFWSLGAKPWCRWRELQRQTSANTVSWSAAGTCSDRLLVALKQLPFCTGWEKCPFCRSPIFFFTHQYLKNKNDPLCHQFRPKCVLPPPPPPPSSHAVPSARPNRCGLQVSSDPRHQTDR